MAEYMAILEHFGVTLGAVSKTGNRIDYVDDLLAEQASVADGLRQDEKRVYFHSRKNQLRLWERDKIVSAGIEAQGAIIVQFFPSSAKEILERLEKEHLQAAGKYSQDVQQTLFRVRQTDEGYEFYVAEINFN